jgi:hypothetical protein
VSIIIDPRDNSIVCSMRVALAEEKLAEAEEGIERLRGEYDTARMLGNISAANKAPPKMPWTCSSSPPSTAGPAGTGPGRASGRTGTSRP